MIDSEAFVSESEGNLEYMFIQSAASYRHVSRDINLLETGDCYANVSDFFQKLILVEVSNSRANDWMEAAIIITRIQ